MNHDPEQKFRNQGYPNLKSEAERRIADFLESNSIKYHYETGLLVRAEEEKPRIWYPDFYLPELGAYIEYFGLVGRQNYDDGIRKKEIQYSKMGLEVIPVYPWTFAGDWQEYIMSELEQIVTRRYEKLMTKPHWSRQKPIAYEKKFQNSIQYHQDFTNR